MGWAAAVVEPALRVLAFSALAGLTFAPLEATFGRRAADRPGLACDLWFASVGALLTHGLLALVVGGGLGAVAALLEARTFYDALAPGRWRPVVGLAAGLLLFELAGYAYHRAAHAIPALWRLHEVHHSAERLDWLASFRQHPLEIVAMTFAQNLPLVLLGLPLAEHALVLVALRLHTVFVHADLPIAARWWTALIAAPSFHHRHHQAEGPAVNFAGLFPWIDRAFGTHDPSAAGPPGLTGRSLHGWSALMLGPFRR